MSNAQHPQAVQKSQQRFLSAIKSEGCQDEIEHLLDYRNDGNATALVSALNEELTMVRRHYRRFVMVVCLLAVLVSVALALVVMIYLVN